MIETKSGEPNVLHYKLNDFEKIQQQIEENQERLDESTNGTENETAQEPEEEILLYPSGVEGILVADNGTTYYEVTHNGITKTNCIVTGNAISDADVVVRVSKAGVIGEAVIELSKDGGVTYDASAVISDTLFIGTLGVTVSFQMEDDTQKFVVGDTFSFKVRENFRVIYNQALSNGFVTIFGHPIDDHKLLIRMLSSGGRGESRFVVSYDSGNTIALQDIVPENGKFTISDNMTLIFSDHAFAKGLEYTADIISNDNTLNLIPVYILVFGLAGLVVAGYVYLKMQEDKRRDYRIIAYKQMKGEDIMSLDLREALQSKSDPGHSYMVHDVLLMILYDKSDARTLQEFTKAVTEGDERLLESVLHSRDPFGKYRDMVLDTFSDSVSKNSMK